MVKSVYVPEAGKMLNFSDDVSPEQMRGYIDFKYPKAAAPAPAAGPDDSTIAQRLLYGTVRGFTDIPGGIAALGLPAEDAEKSSWGQWSAGNRKYLEKTLNIDPTKEATTAQMLAQGLGSAAGFLIPGGGVAKGASMLGAGARLASGVGTATAAAQGVALGAGARAEQIQQQLASGMKITKEQQLAAQRLSGLIGASEALPMQKFFGPIGTLLSKVPASKAGVVEKIISNRLAKITKAGLQEGAQEVASGIANDLMEAGVYNPNVEIGQDLFSNAAGGAFAGSTIEGIIQLAAGRKLRGARQLQADLGRESQQAGVELRRGLIAQAADDLRRVGVDGVIHADEVETPEGQTIVKLVTPDGTHVAETPSIQDAEAVIDLYNKVTGAKATITARPKVAPAKPAKAEKAAEPTPAVGTVRVYHSGSKGEGKSGRWVTTNKKYASDYRKDLPLFYVDIPANDPRVSPDEFNPEQSVSAGFTFNFELNPEEAARLQETQREPEEAVASKDAPKEQPSEGAPVAPLEPQFEGIAAIPVEEAPAAEDAYTPIEEDITEPPIGSVEMPIEEDRVGIDAVPEEPLGAPPEVEPPKQELRPSATDADLTALQTEMFGEPIGYRNMTPEQKAQYDKVRDERFPPVTTDVYNSMAPATGAPKTFREAQDRGPYVRDQSQETQNWLRTVYTQLQNRLDTIAPETKLHLKTLIETEEPGYLMRGQAYADRTPDGIKTFVDLSIGILEPGMTVEAAVNKLVDTLNHEAIHVIRTKGLIRQAEWGMLSRAAQNTNVPGKSYTYMDKAVEIYTPLGPNGVRRPISEAYADPNAVIEEAVADMYRDWVKGIKGENGKPPAPSGIWGLFNRITEFFRRIFRVLKDNRHEQFFRDIESGAVKEREGEAAAGGARFSAVPTNTSAPGAPMSTDLSDRNQRAFDLYPYLRTRASRYYDHKRLILGTTNPGNAAEQIANLDGLLARHPNTLASDAAFADYLADAMGKLATPETGVPIVPYGAVRFAKNPQLIAAQLGRMTPGQLQMAEEGLLSAKDFEKAYRSGTATPIQTAKLILWGILSRGVSPFVQESMFLDVVKPTGISNRTGMAQGGVDQFINDAVKGEFDVDAYMDYVKTLKLDGLPGAGTTHNLGAFGKTTLVKLQQRVPDGRTILQYLHDMISDYSLSGKEIRRRFHEVNPGIGINNKVLSFMMLVSGRDDVLVLDRVQMRNQFNDGRFDDYNLYDGEKIEKMVTSEDGTSELKNVTDTGTGIAKLGDGVLGLMYYEALERDLIDSVRKAYGIIGRGNQFSMGRYHWESWVATSSQEVDHGSVTGLIKEATGEADPYGGIYTGEGKYDTFNSGIRYGYTREGEAYVALPDGLGKYYFFTPEFAKKVIKGYSRASTRIISDANFKVSESTEGPWYDRPEVNKERLRQYLRAQAEVFKFERGRAFSKRVSEISETDPNRPGPGPVHAVRRRGGIRQPYVTHDKNRPPVGTRFSAAPAMGSKEFKDWFGKSKVVDKFGSPLVVYHGTKTKFKAFDTKSSELGSHFGTKEQAAEFVERDPEVFTDKDLGEDYTIEGRSDNISPVYLSIQNPIRMTDFGAWGPDRTARQLIRMGVITEADYAKGKETAKYTGDAIQYLQTLLKQKGYDGIVYLNRREGLASRPRPEVDDGDDQMFKYFHPEAQDSYIIFEPQQAKSIFNKFNEGTRLATNYSAVPLPDYIQQQNSSLFAPATQRSLRDSMFDFFFGERAMEKTIDTPQGPVTLSKWKMRAIRGRQNVVDKDAFLQEIESIRNEQTTGNFQRMTADYSATIAMRQRRRSSHLTASMVLRGNIELNYARPGDIQSATMKVVDDADSLKNIFNVLFQPGPVNPATGKPDDKRDIFRSYAVAKRGEWLRSTGQTVPAQLTPRYVRDTIPFIQRNYPEVVEAYNSYQRFNKKLLTAAMHSGVISSAELARLTNQMNYYGFIYEVYGEPLGPQASQKTASKFKLRAYTGSQRGGLSSDPVFVILQNAQFWVDSMAKNIATTKAYEVSRQVGLARMLGSTEAPDESQGEEPDIMYFSQNGVVKRFAVKDPMLVSSLGSDDRADLGRFWELLGLPSRILRESVTRDPGFMVANLVRDTLSSWITSGADITPFIGTVKGMSTALRDGASYKTLAAYGSVGTYDLAMMGPADLSATLKRKGMPLNVQTIGTREGAIALADTLWNKLGNLSEASDAATRIAVFEAALAGGATEAEAAAQAVEILDFTRRGGSQALSILTKLIPFLNARIQGMDVLYQAGRSGIRFATGKSLGERDANIGKKFLLRGGILAALSLALEALNDDDEDYEQLDDYIKNGNLLIPLKEFGLKGQFIAIPKPFEAGLLFSTIPQQFYKTMHGDASTRDNVSLFTSQISSTFGLNPIPQALLPAFEVITNHDFYTGLPLIPEGKARLSPELQYNSSTSQIAMMLGKLPVMYDTTSGRWEGISPIIIDNLIGGYGGPLGTYLVQGVSLAMEDASIGPERMPQEVSKLPVVKRFFIDAQTKNPKVATQAYELFRVVDEANRSFTRLVQTGDAVALNEYIEKNRDILTYKKYVFKLVDQLNKLSAYERSIERSTDLSREEKLAAQRNIRDVKIRLAANVDQINKALGR